MANESSVRHSNPRGNQPPTRGFVSTLDSSILWLHLHPDSSGGLSVDADAVCAAEAARVSIWSTARKPGIADWVARRRRCRFCLLDQLGTSRRSRHGQPDCHGRCNYAFQGARDTDGHIGAHAHSQSHANAHGDSHAHAFTFGDTRTDSNTEAQALACDFND